MGTELQRGGGMGVEAPSTASAPTSQAEETRQTCCPLPPSRVGTWQLGRREGALGRRGPPGLLTALSLGCVQLVWGSPEGTQHLPA